MSSYMRSVYPDLREVLEWCLRRPVVQINVYFWGGWYTFFGKRADSENHRILEHILQKVTMWTHFFKWLGFV